MGLFLTFKKYSVKTNKKKKGFATFLYNLHYSKDVL